MRRQMVAGCFGALALALMFAAVLHAQPVADYCKTCAAGGYPYWYCVMVGCW